MYIVVICIVTYGKSSPSYLPRYRLHVFFPIGPKLRPDKFLDEEFSKLFSKHEQE